MKVKEVKIKLLKETFRVDFKPYGQIIGLEEEPPLEDFPHLRYWTKNVDLGTNNEKIDVGLLVCQRTDSKVTKMERHKLTSESFIPLTGETIFVMAPADNSKEMPDVTKVRAFLLDGTLGVALNKGTWHWPPIPLRKIARFVLLRKGELSDPTDMENLGVELKLVT